MEPTPDDLRGELKWLRRDEGRTLAKLAQCPAVRAALGDPPEADLLAEFDAAVTNLGFDRKTLALKNAYAIGLRDPQILTTRRETFGARPEVDRGPETINNWEDERIDDLVTRLVAGTSRPSYDHHMIAVAVSHNVITVVAEGESASGAPMRQMFNPNREPFLPGFIYQLPSYLALKKLTIVVLFMDDVPAKVYSEGSADLLAFVCGDENRELDITAGGLPGIDAAAHAAVHWDQPLHGVFYGVVWR